MNKVRIYPFRMVDVQCRLITSVLLIDSEDSLFPACDLACSLNSFPLHRPQSIF